MARLISLKNESSMHKARNSVKCSHSVMSPCTQLWVGQMSGFFQRTGTDNAGRPYCGVVLACSGRTGEDRVPALMLFSPGEGSVSRDARHLGLSSGMYSRYFGLCFRTSPRNTDSSCLPQPDYQSPADYFMQMRRDGFHISPSQALHSFAFIIPL